MVEKQNAILRADTLLYARYDSSEKPPALHAATGGFWIPPSDDWRWRAELNCPGKRGSILTCSMQRLVYRMRELWEEELRSEARV